MRAAECGSTPGVVNACMVFRCMTTEHVGLTSGAMRVLKTSMRLSGSRTGEYKCSLAVRALRRSLDHGNVMYFTSGPYPWWRWPGLGADHQVEFFAPVQPLGHLRDYPSPEPVRT